MSGTGLQHFWASTVLCGLQGIARPWPVRQETWLYSKQSWPQVIRKEAAVSGFPWLPVIYIKGLQVALWDFSQLTDDITVAGSSSNVHACFAILIIIIYYWWSLPVVQDDGTQDPVATLEGSSERETVLQWRLHQAASSLLENAKYTNGILLCLYQNPQIWKPKSSNLHLGTVLTLWIF